MSGELKEMQAIFDVHREHGPLTSLNNPNPWLAKGLLKSMSPDVRRLVETDAKFRFLSVLKKVEHQKNDTIRQQVIENHKRFIIRKAGFRLASVLSQLVPHAEANELRNASGWGSW